jgi:gamma-glutamylcyclotransferase (GGCT)/AIG2-like uncharacterized protein YtfP
MDARGGPPAMSEVLAVYGTLRRGGRLHEHLGVALGRAVPMGSAIVLGDIYEVTPGERDPTVDTSYPCLFTGGSGRVVVDLYRVEDESMWDDLDALEGYLPHDLDNSEYHRVEVPVLDVQEAPGVDTAWTYVYVRRPADPTRRITSGDWLRPD